MPIEQESTPNPTTTRPAELVAGRYLVREELGSGAEGVVWRVEDRFAGSDAALKRAHEGEEDRAAALKLQYRHLARVRHPNVASVDDFGFDERRRPFFTMEVLDAEPLTAEGLRGDLGALLRCAAQVAEALDALHGARLVHGDLKPDNILLAGGAEPRVVLADLGLAAAPGVRPRVSGTPDYMAPEVALGEHCDGRADLYSLGATLFEWIAGHPPFADQSTAEVMRRQVEEPAPRLSSVVDEVPEVLDELVARLLEKDPDARARSGRQVVDALEAAAQSRGIQAITPAGLLTGLFRGRDAELRALRGAWVRARRAGALRTLALTGAPGSGKSRLLDELEWRARLTGAWVGRSACDPDDCDVYAALARAVAPLAARLSESQRDAWARQFPGACVLGVGAAAGCPAPVQVHEALIELCARLPGAALVIIDQAEHASVELREVLATLAAAPGEGRGLVVYARGRARSDRRRPPRALRKSEQAEADDAAQAWERIEEGLRVVALDDLSDAATLSLTREMLGAGRLSERFQELVRTEVKGCPGRLVRLLLGLTAQGSLTRTGGAWTAELNHLSWSAEGISLDDGEQEAIARLTAGLEALPRALLLSCAVLRRGDLELVAEMAGVVPARVAQVIAIHHKSGVIELDRQGAFQVRSRGLCEAIIAQSSEEEVQSARAAAAAALAERSEADPLQVARLALGGRDLERAKGWVALALDALGSSSSQAAQRALIEGLIELEIERRAGPGERAETLWRAIDLIDGLGDHAAVEQLCEDLLGLADGLPDSVDVDLHRAHGWRWLADSKQARGQVEEAAAAVVRGLEVLGDPQPDEPPPRATERVHLLHLRAMLLIDGNRVEEAAALLESTLAELAPRTADPAEHAARIKGTLGQVRMRQGRSEQAAQITSEALSHYERVGDLARAASMHNLYGALAYRRNAWEAMISNFRKALRYSEQLGDVGGAMLMLSNMAYAEVEGGRWDDALATTRRGRLICERIGEQRQRIGFHVTAGLVLLGRGDISAAEDELRACVKLCERSGQREALAVTQGNLGDCAMARGQLDEASRLYEEALAIAVDLGLGDEQTENLRRLAECHLRLGDPARAWSLGRRAARLARRQSGKFEHAQLLRIVGLHHEIGGRQRRAAAVHARALETLDELGRSFEAARVRLRMGVAICRGGDHAVGLKEIARAEQVFKRFGARGELARLAEERQALQQVAEGAGTRAFRKMEILLEASRAINGAVEIDELLESVVDGAVEVSEAERGFLVTRDEQGEFQFQVARHSEGISGRAGEVSKSALRRAFDEAQPSVITDVSAAGEDQSASAATTDPTRSMLSLELKSIMCVPLLLKERVVGAMYVDNRCSPATSFSADDLKLLESLASIAATAMERARLYSRLLTNYRSLERSKTALEQAFTRLQQTREGLIQAEKIASMGQLAAGIAHELKQPLTAIIGRLDILALEQLSERGTRNVEVTMKQALRMRKLVQSMNSYVRQSTGDKEPIDPCLAVHEALALLAERIRSDQIEVSLDLEESDARVMGDDAQLQQVMINLIANAADALEERDQRQLKIESRAGDSALELRITDNGAGIPRDRIHTIFELFETSKPKGKGTGLGLAIVRGIIEEHGGKIAVSSTLGEGTTFRIELPRV